MKINTGYPFNRPANAISKIKKYTPKGDIKGKKTTFAPLK